MTPCSSSTGRPMRPRPSYPPSCADWSPPVQNALSPAPVKTTTPTALSHDAELSASMSSSQVCPRKALYLLGRLIVIRATPSRISYRISVYLLTVSSCQLIAADRILGLVFNAE